MTEITDLNPVDESNTSLTGNGITGGNFVSNFDNAMRGLLGLLGRLNSGAAPISDLFTIADPADLTKQARFDTGLITPGQRRVITLPDQDITLGTGTAAGTTFTPAGNIAATDVQAAIQELDTEKQAASAALSAYPDPTANDADSLGIAGTAWSDLFLATGGVINWNSGSVTITDGGGFLTFGAGTSYRFSTTIRPTANDGGQLGTSTVGWSDLFLAIGGVVNFGQGDVLITHSTNQLAFTLASSGYTFDAAVLPSANDAAALGAAATSWADLFLASGALINFANGNYTITHSSGTLTLSGALSIGTSNAFTAGTIELGAASDTTLSRGAAGFIAVEGNRVPSPASQASGDTLYRGSTEWERLAKGTAYQLLRMNSGATAPEWATAREVLTANRTYYVRSDGSDSNTGLVDSSGGAFLTKAAALAAAARLDCSTYDVTIQVRDGTFTGAAALPLMIGSGTFTLIGNTTTPANCIISRTSADAISAVDCGAWTVRGFKLQTTTGGNGISAQGRTTIRFNTIDFGTVAGAHHIYAAFGANVLITGNYSITGASAYAHMTAAFNSYIQNYSTTVTLTGTPAFSIFAYSAAKGAIDSGSVTFSGSATGQRYLAEKGGSIETNGGGINYFPGNSAGNNQIGGTYA